MDRIGISFQSEMSQEEVSRKFIKPLRKILEDAGAGIYSNYLRQVGTSTNADTTNLQVEHLLVFEVCRFKEGVRLLRTAMEKLGCPKQTTLHNLNSSKPAY
jgi:hypothetical protein